MKLSFHGADRTVTGSCHLIECAGHRVLVDCGLCQGEHNLHDDNAQEFGFDAASIDVVLLTHAHLDHCGRIPLLVKRGFKGEIVTTAASRELARVVLLDAGHLQEEEATYRNKKAKHDTEKTEALYTAEDAEKSLQYFGRVVEYHQAFDVVEGVRATFLDAGHILGAASILVELSEPGKQRRILFSGDIGNAGRPLLRAPETAVADVVVMETTYGNRLHKPMGPSVQEFYSVIHDTFKRRGNVVIPTFALERAQELLYFLREGIEKKLLPADIDVYLDSPMAISATEIFGRHPDCYNNETHDMFKDGKDPFFLSNLTFTRDTKDSIEINDVKSGAVIMAGSGMCTGGRILHHLRNNLGRRECSILFVGYAANGTLARRIIDGAKRVKMYGEEILVLAQIHTVGGFSAHADQAELLAWHAQTNAKHTILVHGDESAMKVFASKLTNTKVDMPKQGDIIEL